MSNIHEEEALGKAYDARLMRRLEALRSLKFYILQKPLTARRRGCPGRARA